MHNHQIDVIEGTRIIHIRSSCSVANPDALPGLLDSLVLPLRGELLGRISLLKCDTPSKDGKNLAKTPEGGVLNHHPKDADDHGLFETALLQCLLASEVGYNGERDCADCI